MPESDKPEQADELGLICESLEGINDTSEVMDEVEAQGVTEEQRVILNSLRTDFQRLRSGLEAILSRSNREE